ncbi:MAG TPA: hypothetical protein VNH42_03685 [Mariprofundaceae bacterium]|nr:hypothetical protein [Mariprofundaceae bacterium]
MPRYHIIPDTCACPFMRPNSGDTLLNGEDIRRLSAEAEDKTGAAIRLRAIKMIGRPFGRPDRKSRQATAAFGHCRSQASRPGSISAWSCLGCDFREENEAEENRQDHHSELDYTCHITLLESS